tara:strand:- start:1826 stop:3058 length:1233 start_codon:yes stop_codon:yes gene_type:complete
MTKYAIYFAVILFPIQTLSIPIKDTAFDLSSILLSITTLFIFFFKKKKNNTHLFILFIFIIYQLIIFIYSPAPFTRFISALYWMVIFIMMFCINKDFKINHQFVEKIIIYILLISCAVSWYQYYYIITPELYNQGVKYRVSAFFSEPSFAGLAFFAAAVGSLLNFLYKKNNIRHFFLFLIFFSTGFLTLSMHIVTFFLSIITIFIFIIYKNDLIFLQRIGSFFIGIIIFILMLSAVAYFIDEVFFDKFYSHILQRVNIFDSTIKSLSLLSWMRGMEQMIYSIKETYIFGFGLGTTGEYYFPSVYGEMLKKYGVFELTLKDSFSLFFRLVIEIGLIFTLIFLLLIFYICFKFLRETISNKDEFFNHIFLFSFSLTMIIGSLIKEPNYARSSLFISIMLISTFFKKRKNIEK